MYGNKVILRAVLMMASVILAIAGINGIIKNWPSTSGPVMCGHHVIQPNQLCANGAFCIAESPNCGWAYADVKDQQYGPMARHRKELAVSLNGGLALASLLLLGCAWRWKPEE